MDRRRVALAVGSLVLLLATALVTYMYATGTPSTLEPGPRSTEHAGIDCTRCHVKYGGVSDAKCLECHADVLTWQWHTEAGGGKQCAKCHYEHAGRDRITDLTKAEQCPRGPLLSGLHDGLRCVECHRTGNATEDCAVCHQRYIEGTHLEGYTKNCSMCHAQDTWVTSFDHANSTGPSGGHHAGPCSDCHTTDPPHSLDAYTNWSADCAECHGTSVWVLPAFPHATIGEPCEPCHPASLDPKWGDTSPSCADCHGVTSWTPPVVDHASLTGNCSRCHEGDEPAQHLTVDQRGGLDCSACHSTTTWARFVEHDTYPGTCTQCHLEDPQEHGTTYAQDCQWCHGTDQWQVTVTHPGPTADCAACHPDPHAGGDAAASVDAEHSSLCGACHVGGTNWTILKVDHTRLGQDCAACHADTHGPVGASDAPCAACHSTDVWVPLVVDHDALGKDCVSCHPTPHPNAWDRWSDQCTLCHVTDDWAKRSFDHDLSNSTGVPCVNCHDDVHKGTLGLDCERCHAVDTWETEVINP